MFRGWFCPATSTGSAGAAVGSAAGKAGKLRGKSEAGKSRSPQLFFWINTRLILEPSVSVLDFKGGSNTATPGKQQETPQLPPSRNVWFWMPFINVVIQTEVDFCCLCLKPAGNIQFGECWETHFSQRKWCNPSWFGALHLGWPGYQKIRKQHPPSSFPNQ